MKPAPELLNLSQIETEVELALKRLGVLEEEIGHVVWPPTRRRLMLTKDQLKQNLDTILTKVRREKDLKKALVAQLNGVKDQLTAANARYEELKAQPGQWTEDDVAEIAGLFSTVNDELDAEAMAEAVIEGTGAAAGSGN